jgi:hypothetical protein
VFLTDTPYSGGGSAQFLEARHRGHATVEDHIRCGKTTGLGRFPSRDFSVNAVWLELSLAAIDLLAWTRVLPLNGELATAEPKKLRYRLLHVAPASELGARHPSWHLQKAVPTSRRRRRGAVAAVGGGTSTRPWSRTRARRSCTRWLSSPSPSALGPPRANTAAREYRHSTSGQGRRAARPARPR